MRMLTMGLLIATLAASLASPCLAQPATAEPAAAAEPEAKEAAAKTVPLVLAEGELSVEAPVDWKQVKPRNRIIEAELAIAGKTPEAPGGRLTVMAAGGSVEANLARWGGQFRATEAGKPKIDTSSETVAGMKLTWFDAKGTYLQSLRGPFGPKVEKPGYRMMAAILQTGGSGNYFFKLVGPADLIEPNAEAFKQMVKSASKTDAKP